MATIYLHRKTNAPSRRLVFPDVDLTGSAIEIELTPRGEAPIVLSTATGELVLDGAHDVIWAYDEALVSSLPLGMQTKWDVYRIIGESREHIGADMVRVLGPGEREPDIVTIVPTTGVQGPKGEKGDQGETGPVGATGATGATGSKGDKGDKGDTGATGSPGTNGTDGASVTVTLVESANWPPAADPNPLHIYVRVG